MGVRNEFPAAEATVDTSGNKLAEVVGNEIGDGLPKADAGNTEGAPLPDAFA
jgi:hypothetical protein